jgi:hypothetical protein
MAPELTVPSAVMPVAPVTVITTPVALARLSVAADAISLDVVFSPSLPETADVPPVPADVIGRTAFRSAKRSARKALYLVLDTVVLGTPLVFGGHDITPNPLRGIGNLH